MNPPAPPDPSHIALLHRLEDLVHKHLLFFRVEVGKAIVEELFGGDLDAWRGAGTRRSTSLHMFR